MDKNRKGWGHLQLGYLFVLLAMMLDVVFFIYPFMQILHISLYNWSVLEEKKFIFIENYVTPLQDKQFWTSFIFTLKYTLFAILRLFILVFALVLLMNGTFRGVSLPRMLHLAPVITPMAYCSMIWPWIYNDLYGVMNYILQTGGLTDSPILWMNSAKTSPPAVISMVTWGMSGFSTFVILAAFQGVGDQAYETAWVDGVGWIVQFFEITLPTIEPQVALALTMFATSPALASEQFSIMTKGGPGQPTTISVHYIYDASFNHSKLGYGLAMTVVILLILGTLSLLQYQIMKDPTN